MVCGKYLDSQPDDEIQVVADEHYQEGKQYVIIHLTLDLFIVFYVIHGEQDDPIKPLDQHRQTNEADRCQNVLVLKDDDTDVM